MFQDAFEYDKRDFNQKITSKYVVNVFSTNKAYVYKEKTFGLIRDEETTKEF